MHPINGKRDGVFYGSAWQTVEKLFRVLILAVMNDAIVEGLLGEAFPFSPCQDVINE
jgi:hypothetical protein